MKKLVGSIISGVGLLIAGTSGLCSLTLLWAGISQIWAGISQNGPRAFGDVIMGVLLFGGIPFVIGIGIHFSGSELVRDAKLEAEKEKARKAHEPRDVQSRSDVSR